MRAAGLFLFIGAVGFINVYDDLVASEDTETSSTQDLSKRLQKKFGVKEKRSAQLPMVPHQGDDHLARNFEKFGEELVEHYRMPLSSLASNPIDCRRASSDATLCSCLRLLCFGGAVCTSGSLSDDGSRVLAKLRPKLTSDASAASGRHLVRCRQTTMEALLLCECKRYSPL